MEKYDLGVAGLNLDHFKQTSTGVSYAGDHILVEFWGVTHHLHDPEYIQQALEDGSKAAKATVIHSFYHHFGDGQGVSGVTILAESHVSIHTWPEAQYAAIDVFMCGIADPNICVNVLKQKFNPQKVAIQSVMRGIISS